MRRLLTGFWAFALAIALAQAPVLGVGSLPANPAATVELTADTPITPEEVTELAEHLDITLDEAEVRVQIQRAWIGFEPLLTAAFPATYGGAWMESGQLNVALTSGADEALPVIQKMFGVPGRVRTLTVEHSLAELLGLQATMMADRLALQDGNDTFSSLSATGGLYDLSVNEIRNTVVVHVEQPEVFASAFADRYGTEMLVVEGNPSHPECTRWDCRYTLQGGLKIWNTTNPNDYCSSAFSTIQPGSSFYYLLSAAHCRIPNFNDIGEWRRQGGEPYGWVSAQVEQGCVDAEAHYRPTTGWFMSGTVLVDDVQFRPMYYHMDWASTPVGPDTWVGKAGATTGTTRGYIITKNFSPLWAPECSQFVQATYCAEGGDSGASIFNTNTAYGIHSGGPGYTCPDSREYGVFGNIVFATNALGVAVLAGP